MLMTLKRVTLCVLADCLYPVPVNEGPGDSEGTNQGTGIVTMCTCPHGHLISSCVSDTSSNVSPPELYISIPVLPRASQLRVPETGFQIWAPDKDPCAGITRNKGRRMLLGSHSSHTRLERHD